MDVKMGYKVNAGLFLKNILMFQVQIIGLIFHIYQSSFWKMENGLKQNLNYELVGLLGFPLTDNCN